MSQQHHDMVVAFVKGGGLVRIRSGPYVHEFARVYEEAGAWRIDNNVLAPQLLSRVSFYDLTFYRSVDLERTAPKQSEAVTG